MLNATQIQFVMKKDVGWLKFNLYDEALGPTDFNTLSSERHNATIKEKKPDFSRHSTTKLD
jgi:hypothetical protein